ncbi:MAG: hypothetical protein U0Q07_14775 [Acidimicrobiales bacterium]
MPTTTTTRTTTTAEQEPARRSTSRLRRFLAATALTVAPAVALGAGTAYAAPAGGPSTTGKIAVEVQVNVKKKDNSWSGDCVAARGPWASWMQINDCIKTANDMCRMDGGSLSQPSYGQVKCTIP